MGHDVKELQSIRSFDFKAYGYPLNLLHLGELVWATFSNGSVCTFNPSSSDSVHTLISPGSERHYTLSFHKAMDIIFVFSQSGILHVWKHSTKSHLQKLSSNHSEVVRSAMSSSYKNECWSGDTEGNIFVWKILEDHNLEELYHLQLDEPVLCLEESENIVWIGTHGRILQVHSASFQLLESWNAHDGMGISDIAWVPSTQQAWSCSEDDKICVWGVTGDLVNTMTGHKGRVQTLCVVEEDTLVLSGSFDKSIVAWDPATSTSVRVFEDCHGDSIRCLSYTSQECEFPFVSGSVDGTVRVWSDKRRRDFAPRPSMSSRASMSTMIKRSNSGLLSGGKHKFRPKTFNKKAACSACPKIIKGNGVKCKVCRVEVHLACQGIVNPNCTPSDGKASGSKAFPGVPLYSMIDTERDNLRDSSDAGSETIQVQAHQFLSHEQEVRLRFMDPQTPDQPLIERLIVATRKASSAKEHLVSVAQDALQQGASSVSKSEEELSLVDSNAKNPMGVSLDFPGPSQGVSSILLTPSRGRSPSPNKKGSSVDRSGSGLRPLTPEAASSSPSPSSSSSSPPLSSSPSASTRCKSHIYISTHKPNGEEEDRRAIIRRRTEVPSSAIPKKPTRSGVAARPDVRALVAPDSVLSDHGSPVPARRVTGSSGSQGSDYVLKIPYTNVYILKDDLPLHRLQYIQACKSGFLPAILDVVKREQMVTYLKSVSIDPLDAKAVEEHMDNRTRALCTMDLQLMAHIRKLMDDCPFHHFVTRDSSEVLDFRRALTIERMKYYKQRTKELEQDTLHLPRYYARSLPDAVHHGKVKLEGHLYLPDKNSVRKTMMVDASATVEDVTDQLFVAISKTVPAGTVDGQSSAGYILKVPGLQEFLYGPIPIMQFDFIRDAVSSDSKISLRLIRKDELETLSKRYADPPVYTLADTLLSQDTAKPKESPEKPIDIYSLKSKFSVCFLSIMDVPPDAYELRDEEEDKRKDKGGDDRVRYFYVQAQVLFGGNLIDEGQSAYVVANSQCSWTSLQGTVEFSKLKTQDIPRGCRLCLVLYMKEGEKRIPLYWVNIQLVYHDSKSNTWSLRSGKVYLSMWKECEKGTVNLYKSIGLCSENVTREAPKLQILFPEHRAEVVFPPLPRPIGPEEVLQRLATGVGDPSLKKDLFHLKEKLKEPGFKEPFLDGGGMRLLCDVTQKTTGNILSYALGALEVALEVSLTLGKGWECITTSDIEQIVLLTDAYNKNAVPNLNAAKSAMRFLSHMIELPDALPSCHLGFPIVYKGILKVGERNHKGAFATLVAALSPHDDIDVSKESLRLINNLLEHAPNQGARYEVIQGIVTEGFNKMMKEVLSLRNNEILLEAYRYQSIRFKMLEDEQNLMYNSQDAEHEKMLMELWKKVFPKKKLKERVSSQWGELGFQGKDPATDFRGMGLLGLRHLLYIATVHKKDFRSIIAQYNKTEGLKQYPVACAGVEISDLLFQMFRVAKYKSFDTRVYRILFDDESDCAMEELYVIIFKVLNKMWYELKAGYMDWPHVKAKLCEKVMASFEASATIAQFKKSLGGAEISGANPFIIIDKAATGVSQTLASRMKAVEKILSYDSLVRLSNEEKKTLWQERHFLTSRPDALFKFLQCVNWLDHTQVLQCYRLIYKWEKPNPQQAIELLDARYTDPMVREFAVALIDNLTDEECEQIVLQLCQVLKYEAYHDSALARFLLRRAYRNTKIGHRFFWNLRAELHIKEIAERYSLLLEAYVRGCGRRREELLNQHEVMSTLTIVAHKVKATAMADRKEMMREVLAKSAAKLEKALDHRLLLPLDERLESSGVVVKKCKSMDSKQVPLWLVFENADPMGLKISVILKVGDDLRQDALTLQMMRLMDNFWKKAGMNLGLNLYGCVATGKELGMIEVVKNAETTAGIQREAGGAKSVLQEDVLTKWLLHHNPGTQFNIAQANFARSCAGYCVATYVLGIADRHNDNIMITKDGFLLHIDFGHFLGNYKKKFGYQRETTPFVFTAQYAHVLRRGAKTSEAFESFRDLCARAYNCVRHEATLFLNLFQLMLCGGIQELQSSDDIHHLRDALSLGLTDEEAGKKFRKKISDALGNTRQKIMDVTHLLKH